MCGPDVIPLPLSPPPVIFCDYDAVRLVTSPPPPPTGRTIGSVFGSLFSARRPLNPARKQKQARPIVDLHGQELQLLCHVVRAFNVPVRRDVDTVRTDYSRPPTAAPATGERGEGEGGDTVRTDYSRPPTAAPATGERGEGGGGGHREDRLQPTADRRPGHR